MDRGAWWATVHGVTESDIIEWLNTYTHTHIHTHTHTWYASGISIKLFKTIQNRSWCQHPPESGLGVLVGPSGLGWAASPLCAPGASEPAPPSSSQGSKWPWSLITWPRQASLRRVWPSQPCAEGTSSLFSWNFSDHCRPWTTWPSPWLHSSVPAASWVPCPGLSPSPRPITLLVSVLSGSLSHLVPQSPSSSHLSRGTTPRIAVSVKALGTQNPNSRLEKQRGGRMGWGVHSNDLEPRLSAFFITLSQELFQRPLCGLWNEVWPHSILILQIYSVSVYALWPLEGLEGHKPLSYQRLFCLLRGNITPVRNAGYSSFL